MRKIIMLILIGLSLPMVAQTDYYVDRINGNDDNTGLSQEHSWKTLQKACNSATPNSVVLIKGGNYTENLTVNVSGTPDGVIVFKNYQNDIVILDGSMTDDNFMLDITDQSHLRFENLIIQNLSGNYAKGINVESTGTHAVTDLTFRNITIRNINWINDPTIIPTADDNAYAFKVKAQDGGLTNLTIDGCHIYNNILGYSEALSVNGNVDNFVIKDCKIHDNTNIGIDVIGHYGASSNPATDFPRNGLIKGNTCYRNVSLAAESAGIYVDGGEDITIERNRCFENGFGIEVGCEQNGTAKFIKVKNNLIYNNHKNGLIVGGYTTDTTGEVLYCTFRNNTFFQNNSMHSGVGEISISKASFCVFEDNLVYANSQNILLTAQDIEPQIDNLINYNCWFTPSENPDDITIYWESSTYHSFSDYKNSTNQDSNSVYGNPNLSESEWPEPLLLLAGGGSCIDTGNPDLSISENETDYDGNPRIVNEIIDMGAREYQTVLATAASSELTDVMVYPNPFATQARFLFNTTLADAQIELFDLTGRKIMQSGRISGRDATLDRNGLTKGVYAYKVVVQNRVIASGKIIAQ